MNDTTPFPYGFPLHELPDLTDEVLFAFHLQIHKLVYLNKTFEKVWEMPRTIIGSDLSVLYNMVHNEDKAQMAEAYRAIEAERQNQNLEFRIVLPDQNEKWIKLKAYISTKRNNDIVIGIATDITEQKKHSETLQKFNDKKNSVLQILAHDLLGPLGNIQTSTYLLGQEAGVSENASAQELVETVNRNCRRSVTMIRDLINNEFLQTSETALVKQRVDIVARLTEIIDQYKQTPVLVQQRFRLTTSSDSLYVNVDEGKFFQAIHNLLSNAMKFTGENGNIEVSISEPDEKNILVTVKDNGIGIPEHLQPFLFDKFTKARRTGVHGEPSTGLGMSIIKTIVEWHNGRIWFESTEGKGTTFYVEIPRDN